MKTKGVEEKRTTTFSSCHQCPAEARVLHNWYFSSSTKHNKLSIDEPAAAAAATHEKHLKLLLGGQKIRQHELNLKDRYPDKYRLGK